MLKNINGKTHNQTKEIIEKQINTQSQTDNCSSVI